MGKKNVHVTPHTTGWQVKHEGAERASSTHKTQKAALQRAKEIAKREKTDVVIHGQDGKIRDRDSYGKDPFPPRDSKH